MNKSSVLVAVTLLSTIAYLSVRLIEARHEVRALRDPKWLEKVDWGKPVAIVTNKGNGRFDWSEPDSGLVIEDFVSKGNISDLRNNYKNSQRR